MNKSKIIEASQAEIDAMAVESEQDRRDLARLHKDLEWLLAHEDAMRVPMATRHLVDQGVDPTVIAKTMLIGDRDGGAMYRLVHRAASLAEHERAALTWMRAAIAQCPVDVSAVQLLAGAVWLAEQFAIQRPFLRELVQAAARRSWETRDRSGRMVGYGVVDLVDLHGVKDRAWLIDAIDHAKLPDYAPLEYSR